MAGSLEFEYGYFPTPDESTAMLTEVIRWIKELKKINLSTELAASMAQEFLTPTFYQIEGAEEFDEEDVAEYTDAVSNAPAVAGAGCEDCDD